MFSFDQSHLYINFYLVSSLGILLEGKMYCMFSFKYLESFLGLKFRVSYSRELYKYKEIYSNESFNLVLYGGIEILGFLVLGLWTSFFLYVINLWIDIGFWIYIILCINKIDSFVIMWLMFKNLRSFMILVIVILNDWNPRNI